MAATPAAETSCPRVCSIRPAGPLTAAPPMIGLIATVRDRARVIALRTSGSDRIGSTLTNGLLGAINTR
jgi:hypothetical protein